MAEDGFGGYEFTAARYGTYPPPARFHSGVDGARYQHWLGELPAETVLALHVHLPFCQNLCRSCTSYTTVPRLYPPIETYVGLLLSEIALVAATLGAPRPVASVHLGGGTPTMLAPADLHRLGRALRARFNLLPDAEFTVDVDPRSLTLATAAALGELGATGATLGVQDVSPNVQRAIDRWQPLDLTERAVNWLRYAGVRAIELELLYGLPEQTERLLLNSLEAVLALAPTRIIL